MGGASPQRSAIATVMFTDAESSTALTTLLGDEAAERMFAGHDRIVRDRIVAHGGRRIETTGDGFLALFDSARSAVTCALEIQHDLAEQPDGIRVRIGLNAGEVMENDEALFGAAINLAKRVMDRAAGGEILVTETVRQLAGTVPDARFRDRGRTALKGFPERQHLFAVQRTEAKARPAVRAPRRRSRGPLLVAAALLVAAVAIGGALMASGAEDTVAIAPNSVAVIDAGAGRVVGSVPVGVRPFAVADGAGSIWVANAADGTVSQIAPGSRRVVGTVATGVGIAALSVGADTLWATGIERPVVQRIDPEFRTVARSVRIGDAGITPSELSRPVAATADAVWVTYGAAQFARVDPGSGRIAAKVPVGVGPSAVAVGAGAVWVADERDGTVTRIDPRTNATAATIAVGASASGIAVGAGGVWVAVPREDRVKRIDPATDAVTDTVRVAGGPAGVAVGDGSVWVTSRRGGTVTEIDPGAAQVERTIAVGHSPQGIAVVGEEVWVAVQEAAAPPSSGGERPDDVLAVVHPQELFGGTDPALIPTSQETHATCAMLLNYSDEPFPAGSRLQPEVARAMPEVGDGGRTYTFRLRPGFRFSPPSGAPVTADAFRRAIERGLHSRTQSYAAEIMGDVDGFDAYRSGRAKHVSGVTARGDTLTIRLARPSSTLPARMASLYFCAVPPNTPISPAGLERIPMAGPYYIATYVPGRRLVLRRNPNYGGQRPARFREIDIDLDIDDARALEAVESGRVDYLAAVTPDRIAGLDRRYGPDSAAARAGAQRYFTGPAPSLHVLAFNMRRPTFADRDLRVAVNEALDRTALARLVLYNGPAPGRPTDQFTAPGQPGFRDAAIYPLGGPDVERARRLAGDRRRRAVLYTCTFPFCREHGRILTRNLAAIGIDLDVRHFPLNDMFVRLNRRDEPWDLAYFNWFIDFADPSQFVAQMWGLGAPGNIGGFRDAELQGRIRAAEQLADEAERSDAFAELDADLARAGAGAPFASGVTTDFFSDRIGCQVHQPIHGISLGALCERE